MRDKGKWPIRVICLLAILSLGPLGCIRPEAQPPAPPISVAGEYKTDVTLTNDNTCGAVEVQSLPTTITHEPGATELVFTHAGNSYEGTLESNGNFATAPTPLVFGKTTYTLTVTGQFSVTGFDALTTVAVQQPQAPQTCRYVVHMVGSKAGSENIIPQ